MRAIVLAISLLSIPATALADPVGTYRVLGTNPGDDSKYTGKIKVTRSGEAYRVEWNIGDDQTIGTGLGGRIIDGRLVIGKPSAADTVISVAYESGSSYGAAFYAEQPDGTWKGQWIIDGSDQIATETWTPREKKKPLAEETVTQALNEVDTEFREIKPLRALSSPIPAVASPKN